MKLNVKCGWEICLWFEIIDLCSILVLMTYIFVPIKIRYHKKILAYTAILLTIESQLWILRSIIYVSNLTSKF